MADLLTDDELELEEQRKRDAAQPIGDPIGATSSTAPAPMATSYAPHDTSLAPPKSEAIGEPIAPAAASMPGLSTTRAPMDANAAYDTSLTPPKQESIGEPLSLSPGPAARPNYEA